MIQMAPHSIVQDFAAAQKKRGEGAITGLLGHSGIGAIGIAE